MQVLRMGLYLVLEFVVLVIEYAWLQCTWLLAVMCHVSERISRGATLYVIGVLGWIGVVVFGATFFLV